MKELYNSIYPILSKEKKKDLLENLAKKYNMEIIKFETFSKYSKSTFTAIFKYKESEFVFVPGDTVTLGYEGVPKNLSNKSLEQLKYFSENPSEFLEEYIKDNFSKIREVTIKPMLVERRLQTIGWRKSDLEELKNFDSELIEEYNNFKSANYNSLTLDETARFTKNKNGNIEIELYDDITYDELCENLKDEGFSLPNLDEWEYLCGGGCRTLFPWGDDIDYNMKFPYFSDGDDLEIPNFFGIFIAYDPYKEEVIEGNKFFKGGDGGCNICGGSGIFLGYLPCSPYFNMIPFEDELDGDFNFYRGIIRIEE